MVGFGARAASVAARLPPAILFPTTTGWPNAVLSRSAKNRAERSALPPGGNGTMMTMDLLGQSCEGGGG